MGGLPVLKYSSGGNGRLVASIPQVPKSQDVWMEMKMRMMCLCLKIKTPRSLLSTAVFRELRAAFEECYGRFLQIDLFARERETHLSICGFSSLVTAPPKVQCVLMLPPLEVISEAVLCLRQLRVLAIVVVPRWETHTWYTQLLERATHKFSLPVGNALWKCCCDRSLDLPHTAFFVDARYEKRECELQEILLKIDEKKGRNFSPLLERV